MTGPERKPGQRPRARAPRNDHPFRPSVEAVPEELEEQDVSQAVETPEPAPTPAAPAQSYDPQVAIGGRGPQSVRTRLKLWCVGHNEHMDRVLVRAITEFLDRNGG